MRNNWKTLENKIRDKLELLSQENSQKEIVKLLKMFNLYCVKVKERSKITDGEVMKLFSFYITEYYYKKCEFLVNEEKKFPSIAECLRIAIREFIEREFNEKLSSTQRNGEVESEG